jgi:hypothetical protein
MTFSPPPLLLFEEKKALAMELASSRDTVVVAAPATTTTTTTRKMNNNQQENENLTPQAPFRSAASPKTEYTNSIVASRDTNISPLEVYDTIKSRLQLQQQQQQQSIGGGGGGSGNGNTHPPPRSSTLRALDVGAGAGVSTQVIYDELGITTIDAVDWSGDAWQINVVEQGACPSSVHFYAMDDERFVETIWKTRQLPKYDVIAFNFAINRDKALYFCHELLEPDTGLLLAPINTQTDYWLKQTYQVWNAQGQVTWSANDVGAWSVQFQPDVTADTCQGIWCAPYNGFQKQATTTTTTQKRKNE